MRMRMRIKTVMASSCVLSFACDVDIRWIYLRVHLTQSVPARVRVAFPRSHGNLIRITTNRRPISSDLFRPGENTAD